MISSQRILYRLRGCPPTPDGALHRPGSAARVGCFTGKPQRTFDTTRKLRRSLGTSNQRVAVSATDVDVTVPVVSPHLHHLRFDAPTRDAEVLSQRAHRTISLFLVWLAS